MVNEENDSVPENKGLKVVRELDFNKQKDILKKMSIENFGDVQSFFEKINPDYDKFLKEEKRFHLIERNINETPVGLKPIGVFTKFAKHLNSNCLS
ncbi:MAG: hypothetical protein MJY93_01040 [Fibrobacter sp.]|nr:hypothetical protein [Fibrobacter sp.]